MYPEKLPFRTSGEIKYFQDKKQLQELVAIRLVLQEIQKRTLHQEKIL